MVPSGWIIVRVHSAIIESSAIFLTETRTAQVPTGNSTVLGLHLFSSPVVQNQKSIRQE